MINKCTTIFFEQTVLQVLKILLMLRTYNILSNKPYDNHGIGDNIVLPVLQYSKYFFGTIILGYNITV